MKKHGLFFFITILLCVGVVGCGSGLEEADDSGIEENLNAQYENVTSIQCIENYNAYENTSGDGYYVLELQTRQPEKCRFYYLGPKYVAPVGWHNGTDAEGEFTPEKYYEIKELLFKRQIIPYEIPSDENGKLISVTEPYMFTFMYTDENNRYQQVYFIPENIDEVMAELFKLIEISAEKPEWVHIDG